MTIDQEGTHVSDTTEPVAGAAGNEQQQPAAAPATVQTTPTESGVWYCDQCGARYDGPGLCANQHPATELVELSPAAAAETGTDAAPIAEGSTTTPAADPTPAPEPTPPAADAPTTITFSQTLSVTIAGETYAGTVNGELTRL